MKYTIEDIPPELAKECWQAMDACNASGIIHTMHEVVCKLWIVAHEKKQGTEYVNKHPILALYIDKLAQLNGIGCGDVQDAYDLVHKVVELNK